MTIKKLVFVCFVFSLACGCVFAEKNLYVVRDGKPSAIVVVPEKADRWTNEASKWFRDYIEKSAGARLEIVEENRLPDFKGTIVSIGHTRLAGRAQINLKGLRYDGCKLIAKGNVLYLLGRDDGEFKNDWGGDVIGAKGTCRAVVTFLEDFVGVRWFLPVPEGVEVPEKRDIYVPSGLNKTVIPAFAFAHGRYPYGHGTAASIANNYRTGAKILTYGGHSFYLWLPVNKYFDEHPEYFALINGERVKQGNHLCTSNPEVRKILLANLRKEFDNGWDWVALGAEDGYLRCQCPDCEKLDNFRDFAPYGWGPMEGETWDEFLDRHAETPNERLLQLYKWLADECRKSHPDKKIHMLIYGPTVWPSKKFAGFGDNVIGEIALYNDRLTPKLLDMWKGKVQAFTLMRTWFDVTGGGMGVSLTPNEASKKIRTFHGKGVIGIYGIYGANWGISGPVYYVLGKLMGNPELDYSALVEEYCMGVYGKAGQAMKDFFDILYSRSPESLGISDKFTSVERHLIIYQPVFLHRLDSVLERAETIAKEDTESVRKFVELTRLSFDYLKLVTNMLVSYQAYQANETRENLQELKERVDEFEKYRVRVISQDDEYTRLWPNHSIFCKFLVGGGIDSNYYANWNQLKKKIDMDKLRGTVLGFSGSAIRRPITLDFKQLEEGKKKFEIVVKRVPQAPKLDGILDNSEWGNADVQDISPMTKESASLITTVRAIYDHANLYIAFECEEPVIEKMKIQGTGKDGGVWYLDHVELFFDPESSMRRRYHLMVAPHDDAGYDSRIGFHGMYDADVSWNGEWEYGFNIDKENKKWAIELAIPFGTLEMQTPEDGEAISGNFARARYAGLSYGGHDPELYLWSQGETGAFSDPAVFGTLVFKHVLY